MYSKEKTLIRIFDYLKSTRFRDLDDRLWDKHLWFFDRLLISFEQPFLVVDKKQTNMTFYTLKNADNCEGIACVESCPLYVHICLDTENLNKTKVFLREMSRFHKKPLRISMIDPNGANKLATDNGSLVYNDFIRYALLDFEKQNSNDSRIAYVGEPMCEIIPVNVFRGEIRVIFPEQIDLIIDLEKMKVAYEALLRQESGRYQVITWKISTEEQSLVALAEALGFVKCYSEYFFDIE